MRSAPITALARLALAVACALGLSACSDEPAKPVSSATATASPEAIATAERKADAARAAEVLHTNRKLLAGAFGPEWIENVGCAPRSVPTDYDCSFILDQMDQDHFRVRLQDDGTVTKLLANGASADGGKTAADVSELLAADDRLQAAPARTRNWSCARSPRLEPDGTSASTGAGYLCTTFWRVEGVDVQRYVELAPDGTARRDFVLRPQG